jgi:hypothetical protein
LFYHHSKIQVKINNTKIKTEAKDTSLPDPNAKFWEGQALRFSKKVFAYEIYTKSFSKKP